MLNWLKPFSIFCLLDNAAYSMPPHRYEMLVAVGAADSIEGDDLQLLDAFKKDKPWLFGHLSYDLKNSIHQLQTNKPDRIGFSPYFFFAPQIVLALHGQTFTIHAVHPNEVLAAIEQTPMHADEQMPATELQFSLTKEAYIEKIKTLQKHILRGDCYEINFCIEAFAEDCTFYPFTGYRQLAALSPNPFGAFYRNQDKYLLCASPERFIARKGNTIYSQPIKGTIARDKTDAENDALLQKVLSNSSKDQSENVMVVDLVRNDLSMICEDGSIKVEELFGVYAFPQVYQMISTITGQLKQDTNFSDILRATFPMGSMTGAPKHRVMQLIEDTEPSARGIFSGSVGYINPAGDFDFNVVIRSMMYNHSTKTLSSQVGSGITFYSNPENEWEECMLKFEAVKKVLKNEAALEA